MVGIDWPSSARETHSDESGTHRSGRLSLPLTTLWATVCDGAALMVNCKQGAPLSCFAPSALAADSSWPWSSGVVLSETWTGFLQDPPPSRLPAPFCDPKERTTKTAPNDTTSTPTAVRYTGRRFLLLRVTAEEC